MTSIPNTDKGVLNMKSILNHVSILVESIESTLDKGIFKPECIGEIEEFPSEGTRELYISLNDQMGKLLLMQAIGPGPYQNSLRKRGAGLHHIGIDVLNVDEFVASLSGSGWFLHPKSLSYYKNSKQVWLTRPGTPVLIEVQERKKLSDDKYYIEELCLPIVESRLLESLCCERLIMGECAKMIISGKEIVVGDLLK